VLSLDGIRDFRLKYRAMGPHGAPSVIFPFPREALVTDAYAHRPTLSAMFPVPASSSLKTPVPVDCLITKGFIAGLAQLASDRENTTSPSPNRVVITGQLDEHFPIITLIWRLRKRILVVKVMEGVELPKGLSGKGSGWLADNINLVRSCQHIHLNFFVPVLLTT